MLDGTARHVLDGDRASRLAVVTDAGVFVVASNQVSARRSTVFDPVLHVADLSFAGVRVPDTDRLTVDAERAHHFALTGMAITMVGACQRILDLVLEHVRSRQQFGVPIGSFQAVQHKAADMHVAVERARALAYFAALTIAGRRSPPPAGRRDGQSVCRGMPIAGIPAWPAAVRRDGIHLGERPAIRTQAGQSR